MNRALFIDDKEENLLYLQRHWNADERLRLAPFVVCTATYTEADEPSRRADVANRIRAVLETP